MILYHGSYLAIEKPDLAFSRKRTDFGQGFYVTPLKEQAISWARRFVDKYGTGVVSSYAFLHEPGEKLPNGAKVLEFDTHSREWLDFIMACRLGRPGDAEWDLVIGGVANDKVFDTLQLYFDKMITADTAIDRLRYHKPNFQYCFKKQALTDEALRFTSSEEIR
jgi:hypothetical protein